MPLVVLHSTLVCGWLFSCHPFYPRKLSWLYLVGAIATVLISIALIVKSLNIPENQRSVYQMGARVGFTGGILAAIIQNISSRPLSLWGTRIPRRSGNVRIA
jgi:hypothetical protein